QLSMGKDVAYQGKGRTGEREDFAADEIPRKHAPGCGDLSNTVLMRVPDYAAHSGQGTHFFGCSLRVTSGHQNPGVRLLSVDAPNCRTCILVGCRRDCAGIEYDHVRIFGGGGRREAMSGQIASNCGAICLSGATAEVVHKKTRHGSIINISCR